jgi:geranylgeranyl reductase family protein
VNLRLDLDVLPTPARANYHAVYMDRFDVLIVGAGPAGSFAAERLARGGVRVALFDGRPPGEPKACGGGVTSKALKAWPHLLDAVGRTIDELDMYSPSGKHLHLKLDEPFAVYSRNAFDTFLLERARAAGARVFAEKISGRGFKRVQGKMATVRQEGSLDPVASTTPRGLPARGPRSAPGSDTEDGWIVRAQSGAEFFTDWLVGADGANSAIAKKLAGPLPPAEMEVAFGYRAPLPVDGDAATVVAFLPKWDGYAWAFPRLDHVSLGIATSQDSFDHDYLESLLWDFIGRYYRSDLGKFPLVRLSEGEIESKKAELGLRFERYAARIPKLREETLNERKTLGSDWALLGDAAGFADAVTGEGIYYALRSAELFTRCYLDACPQRYEETWRNDFGRDLARAARVRPRFYGSFLGDDFTNRMIQLSSIHSGIRRTLTGLVAGNQGYVNLKRTLIRRFVLPLGK